MFKNQNESAYVGGKKHWTDVIKNSGPGELLIWRQPEEDFNTNSTIVVMPGEEAIFIKGGTIEAVFENGTYKLSTENYPFISRLRNAFSGGVSTFNCVVYFVRKADSEEIIWGTDSPIQVRDKVYGIRTDVKARGAYKVRIESPAIFIEKLIGNNVPLQFQTDLNKYFQHSLEGKIKSVLSKFLNSLNRELIGIDAYLDELSEKIVPFIDDVLSEYGLKCVAFSLSALDVDQTKYDRIDESQIIHIEAIRGYENDKAGFDILGSKWTAATGAKILKDLANNPNSGGVASAGAGLGMGLGTTPIVNALSQQTFAPVMSAEPQDTFQSAPTGRYTQQGAVGPSQTQQIDDEAVLAKLKRMLDSGLITREQYDSKVNEVLSRM